MKVTGKRSANMRDFVIVWFGQVVSMLGTGMTNFALSVWAWEMTGAATSLALLLLVAVAPPILLGPLAGVVVDRRSRKSVIILADVGAALSTAIVLLLYATGHLQVWHMYLTNLLAGVSHAFQQPAFSASITLLVPKEQYGRANGMMGLVYYIPEIVAPLLAGLLMQVIGISGIMLIDLITFAFAVVMTVLIYIPQPEMTSEGQKARGSLWHESTYGFRYLLKWPGLLGITLVFLAVNFAGVFQWALQSPMVLARTAQDSRSLGMVLSVSGVGNVIGGFVMSAWGGPKRRIHGVLAGMALECLLGIFLMGLGRTVPIWALAGFLLMFFVPIVNSSNRAILQAKVPPDIQGRVFTAGRMIAQGSYVVGFIIAGPLADLLFEPAMQPDGLLAGILGGLFGTGPGTGMALLMAICGLLGAGFALAGYLFPVVRNVEAIMPDHDAESALSGEDQ